MRDAATRAGIEEARKAHAEGNSDKKIADRVSDVVANFIIAVEGEPDDAAFSASESLKDINATVRFQAIAAGLAAGKVAAAILKDKSSVGRNGEWKDMPLEEIVDIAQGSGDRAGKAAGDKGGVHQANAFCASHTVADVLMNGEVNKDRAQAEVVNAALRSAKYNEVDDPEELTNIAAAAAAEYVRALGAKDGMTADETAVMAGQACKEVMVERGANPDQAEQMQSLNMLDVLVDERLGDSCPDVVVDLNRRQIRSRNIEFKRNKTEMINEYEKILKQVAKTLSVVDDICNAHNLPQIQLEVAGHTRCPNPAKRANKAHMSLSKARAKTVYKELLKMGSRKSMLQPKGYGGTVPIEPTGKSSENQRVEFEVIKNQEFKLKGL